MSSKLPTTSNITSELVFWSRQECHLDLFLGEHARDLTGSSVEENCRGVDSAEAATDDGEPKPVDHGTEDYSADDPRRHRHDREDDNRYWDQAEQTDGG